MTTLNDRLKAAASEIRELTDGVPLPVQAAVETRPERHRVPAWSVAGVAAVLVLVVVGLPILLFSGGESIVADQPATTAPPSDTTVSPATVAPPVTTMAPAPLPYDEVLDSSAAALFTSMVVASDGSPVIVSLVSDANVVGSYEETTISVIRLVKCLDPECVEPPVIVDLADVYVVAWTNGRVHLALDPFDRPVILYPSEEGPKMAFCDDPMCTSFETRQGDEANLGEFGDWAFTPDGNPVYPSLISERPHQFDLVACLDRYCDAVSSTRIEDTKWGMSSWPAPRVAADGSVLLVYSTEEPIGPPDPETGYDGDDMYGTQKVAWCADAACSDGPVITTIDEGMNVGGGMLSDGGEAGDEIWFVTGLEQIRTPTGPEDEHLAVAEVSYGKATCLNTACTEFELTHLGPYEMAGSSSSPLPYGLPETVARDGSRMQLRHRETALVLERFSETGGGIWAYATLPAAECADGFHEGYCEESYQAILAIGGDGLPIVVYGDDTGLHVIRCPDLACTPPDGG
jgi:hypothetical protein